ncbi:MAG: hypothetical protein DWG80_06320 [Chloroflexi bacterium]|nr:hypothetical protein [Chloroflexota bacterium]
MLAGPADVTRPANPWPRLLIFFGIVIGAIVLVGLCTTAFLSTPEREIRVRMSEFQLGTPKFLAVVSFGHDRDQMTFGAFLAVPEDEVGSLALFSRDPDSGCNLRWQRTPPGAPPEPSGGIYVDPCSDARYAFDGRALHEHATRDLHRFPLRREVNSYVVNFEEMTLGGCRGANLEGCSPAGTVVTREVPGGLLPQEFGTR